MTVEELAILVRDMRAAQNRYETRGRLASHLRACVDLEQAVDSAVSRVIVRLFPDVHGPVRRRQR